MTDKTLRDEIAIAAMQGLLMGSEGLSQMDISEIAYSIAECMLKQREIKEDV